MTERVLEEYEAIFTWVKGPDAAAEAALVRMLAAS